MRYGWSEQPMSAPDTQTEQPASSSSPNGAVTPVRIVLLTDEPLYRDGMQMSLRESQCLVLLAERTINDAVALAEARLADMTIIDACCREKMEMAKALALRCPQMPIVVVSETATADEVGPMVAAGIRGYILKRVTGSEFVRILASIAQGGSYVPPELGAGLLRQSMRFNGARRDNRRPYGLTAREEQILACVARALTNKEVARELKISEKTVKHYMTVIMEKLQVRNRVQAVRKLNAWQWDVAS